MRLEHPFDSRDVTPAQANREARAAAKGKPLGVESRDAFDAKKMAIAAPDNVTVTAASVGGIPGFWCRPVDALRAGKILFFHGGGYVLGSAKAFTNFAGQIATRARADTFVVDYRLAPEHPFPAGLEDAAAVYKGLATEGAERIAIVGDSAGGGLALVLLSMMAEAEHEQSFCPVAAAVMSPWLDMTLAGDTYFTRAEADPVFTREVLRDIAITYLGDADPRNPMASPLFGTLKGLPPIRIDIGDDEVLLDEALKYETRATQAGVSVSLNIWKGMPHVFQTGIGRFIAADQSLNAIGQFLHQHLAHG